VDSARNSDLLITSITKIEIDLLEYKAISNPYFKIEFEKNKQLIYGQ